MLNVFITVDVETWCDGWEDIDKKFPTAFKKYIYGETPDGEYGLPFQIKVLNNYNIKAVFFVEPLFSARFGLDPLAQIVGMLKDGNQEVQMHMHPEWTNEAREPIIENSKTKRQHMKHYSQQEQKLLIKKGIELFNSVGEKNISAFRAGGFGANNETLHALLENGFKYDSSYNFTATRNNCEIRTDGMLLSPTFIEGIREYPMTCYIDYPGHYRHMQVGACTFEEMKKVLDRAERNNYDSVVLLSHSFELLTRNLLKPDNRLVARFENLCAYLAENRDRFRVVGFNDITTKKLSPVQPRPIKTNIYTTLKRYEEQYKINRYNNLVAKSIL